MVIVEYCRYGNLLNHLIKRRNKFINEIDSLGNLVPKESALLDQELDETINVLNLNR